MEWILGIATLIGGIAALVYFWDKIRGWFGRNKGIASPGIGPEVKWVDLNYPAETGLQSKLERQGYTLHWSRDDSLARRLNLEEWEKVVIEEQNREFLLKVSSPDSPLTLVKKRMDL